MQFMPLTWIGWSYSGGNDVGNANGDGKVDRWNMDDAIFSAANSLQKML